MQVSIEVKTKRGVFEDSAECSSDVNACIMALLDRLPCEAADWKSIIVTVEHKS